MSNNPYYGQEGHGPYEMIGIGDLDLELRDRLAPPRGALGGARQYGRLGAIGSRHLRSSRPESDLGSHALSSVAELGDKEWKFRSAVARGLRQFCVNRCALELRREKMPLWKVYHPVGAYTEDDKHAFAKRIADLYSVLPRFYVNVIFQEVPKNSFYIGGEPVDNFIRFSIEHIARNLPQERRALWLDRTNEAIAPFVRDRGFDWEFHIDETPIDLWSVQGYCPPLADSEDEKRWARENKASPRTHS